MTPQQRFVCIILDAIPAINTTGASFVPGERTSESLCAKPTEDDFSGHDIMIHVNVAYGF